MLLLVSTSDKVQIVTSDATTTLDVRADAIDAPNPITSGATQTPYNKNTTITGVTAGTDVVVVPGASTVRNVKRISVVNTHATLPQTFRLTVVNASGTADLVPSTTIQAKERFVFDSDGETKVFDSGGKLKNSSFATAAGSAGDIQYNDGAGNLAGAANVEIDNGDLLLRPNASPVTPPATTVKIFGHTLANRHMPAFVGPAGLGCTIQPLFARKKIGIWSPPGNATTVPGVFGFGALTATGTATARNVASTNMVTRAQRLGYVSAAAAGSLAGGRGPSAQYTIGGGGSPALGGFFFVCRFAPSDAATVSGRRMFVGLSSSIAAPTNVEPSTLTNVIGVAELSTSSNLQIVYGGSAAQTAIDLGSNFPGNTLSVDLYELVLFAAPTGTVHYKVTRLNTNHTAEGQLTGTAGVALPAATTFLNFQGWVTNNATALAVALDIVSIYVETDQ